MMLNLFIDTNAYLTFYHLSSDDLEELKKIKVLLNNSIQLCLPEQTKEEFYRNRETKIADGLKRFKEEKLNNQFPQIAKQYSEYEKMRSAIVEFEKNKNILLKKLYEDIFKFNLDADHLIRDLFQNSNQHKTTQELVQNAKLRYQLGNPPGKNNSYGDAINWETLLLKIPQGDDLYFVSEDKDFYSEIDNNYFNNYLIKEWRSKKYSNIFHFKRISDFFKEKFPEIKIASEYEKDKFISELRAAGSFAKARGTLRKISHYDEFSTLQLNNFVETCIVNSQIYRIKDDPDIKEMIEKVVVPNIGKIDPSILFNFLELFEYNKPLQ